MSASASRALRGVDDAVQVVAAGVVLFGDDGAEGVCAAAVTGMFFIPKYIWMDRDGVGVEWRGRELCFGLGLVWWVEGRLKGASWGNNVKFGWVHCLVEWRGVIVIGYWFLRPVAGS